MARWDFSQICAADEVVILRREDDMPLTFWLDLIETWIEDNNINAEWQGEWTHRGPEGRTYYTHWSIPNAHERTLFLLRWL